jgi:hypothetical protein
MAHSLEIQTPEQTRSTEEIAQAFDYAQMAVGAMQRDPSFHASCVENGVDPQKDRHSIAYWEEFRLYVGERTDKAREEGHDSLQMDAIELLANTPNYLLVQEQLNKHQHRPYDAVHHSKEVASYYNGLLRSFALNYPETSVEDLEVNLLTTVNKNFHSKHLRTVLANDVTPPIRGAQHELAFGQVQKYVTMAAEESSIYTRTESPYCTLKHTMPSLETGSLYPSKPLKRKPPTSPSSWRPSNNCGIYVIARN